MMTVPAIMRRIVCLCLVVTLGACASTSSQLASPYVIQVQADKGINVAVDGQPSPVQVTVYELKSQQGFEHGDFFSLFEQPRELLAQDLLHMEQFVLQPGGEKRIARPGNVQARWVGIVVAYREIERMQWRSVADLPEPVSTNFYKVWQFNPREETLFFHVTDKGVSLTDRERPFLPKIF